MCQDSITGIVISLITVPVMIISVPIALRYCNWKNYNTGNADSITGIVISIITIPVMVISVPIA